MKKFEVGKSYKSNKLGKITVIKRTAQFVTYTRQGTRYDGQTFRSKIRVSERLGEYICANGREFFAEYELTNKRPVTETPANDEPAPETEPVAAQEAANEPEAAAMTAQEVTARKLYARAHELRNRAEGLNYEGKLDDSFVRSIERLEVAAYRAAAHESAMRAAAKNPRVAAAMERLRARRCATAGPDSKPEAVTETAPEYDYGFLSCRYTVFEYVCGAFSNEFETDSHKEVRNRLKEEWDGSLESGDWGLFDRDARQYIRIRATAKGRKAFRAENARLAMKADPRSEFVLERLYSQAERDGELERLHYAEIGGGYSSACSDTPHVEIWTEKVAGDFFATTIYNHTLVYSTRKYADTPEQAERDFTEARGRYLQPLQAAAFSAGMVGGGKYTILCYSDFGHLVAQKIRFHGMEPTTYAQYGDAVRITCTPFRKRGKHIWTLYNKSFAIYEGWQDLPESATMETLRETPEIKVQRWKFSCWDANGFTACKDILKNRLALYEDFKRGVNGKMYA